MNNILVLGSGAWGTAIADLIANNTKKISTYGHMRKRWHEA